MDKVQKHNSFNTNTPLSESYRNHCTWHVCKMKAFTEVPSNKQKLWYDLQGLNLNTLQYGSGMTHTFLTKTPQGW
jgi:hypothetical protein